MLPRTTTDRLLDIWNRRKNDRRGSRPHRKASGRLSSEQLEPRAMLSADGFRSSVTADDVAVDATGNTYLVGSFRGTVDFDPGVGVLPLTSAGRRDGYVAKFDAAGAALWVRGISSSNTAAALAVAVDASGTVVVGGTFNGIATLDVDTAATLVSAGGNDGFVAVYDASGSYQWAEAFGTAGNDAVLDVAAATTGVVVAGELTPATPAADAQAFVAARATDGTFLWNQDFGATWESSANAVVLTAAGQVVVGGSFEGDLSLAPGAMPLLTGQGREDGFVAVLDGTTGSVNWAETIGGSGDDEVRAVAVDSTGLIVVGGQLEEVPTTAGTGLAAFQDDGSSLAHHDDHDDRDDEREQGFVAVLSAAGVTQWSQSMPAESDVRTVAVDPLGTITIGGTFEGQLLTGPAATSTAYDARGREQGFVMQLDSLGSTQWATPFDGGRTQVNAVASDAAGNTFVASTGGIFRGGYLTELDSSGLVLRSDSFAAASASRWHRHESDDAHDELFEDDWDDDGPPRPLSMPTSTKTVLPLRIEVEGKEPLFLNDDDAEREKVRRSLEHRASVPDAQPYDFSVLTQGQLALLQAWSAYATSTSSPLPTSPDSSHLPGSDDSLLEGELHDETGELHNDEHHDHDDDRFHDDDREDHDDHTGSTLPVVFDATGRATLTGTVAGEHDTKRFVFVANSPGVVTVTLSPDARGFYPEVEVEDATTDRELLELEPHERRGRTTGSFAVTAGRTYVLKAEAPEDWVTVNLNIGLQLS